MTKPSGARRLVVVVVMMMGLPLERRGSEALGSLFACIRLFCKQRAAAAVGWQLLLEHAGQRVHDVARSYVHACAWYVDLSKT